MLSDYNLRKYLMQSNNLSNINTVLPSEFEYAKSIMLNPTEISINDLEKFAKVISSGSIRDKDKDNILLNRVCDLLDCVNLDGKGTAVEHHLRFNFISPFTSGNSRTSRLLYLWQRLSKDNAYHILEYDFPFLQDYYFTTAKLYS